jgi:hypothetical protein
MQKHITLRGLKRPQRRFTRANGLGSLQRRLRNCMIGMRAETYPNGAPGYVDMEFFLMWRAGAMKMQSPGVQS